MDKFLLQQQALERLAEDLQQAERVARAAHETATQEENIAESKHDTLVREVAYLATGQVRRADPIRQAMARWRQFRPRPCDTRHVIQLGAPVSLGDADSKPPQKLLLLLGPDGGSMQLLRGDQFVRVISGDATMGRAGPCWVNARVLRCRCRSLQVAAIRQPMEVLQVH